MLNKEELKMTSLLKLAIEDTLKLYLQFKGVEVPIAFISIKDAAKFIAGGLSEEGITTVDYLTKVEWREKGLFINNLFYKLFWGSAYDDESEYLTINERLQMDNSITDNLDRHKEEIKMASLLKLAKQEDIAFDANAFIRVWVDITDLEYETEIENIKKMSISEDEKIKLAKNFAKQVATNKISENDVQIKGYDDLDQTFDRINWAALVSSETEE